MISTTSNNNLSSSLSLTLTLLVVYVTMHMYMLCIVDTAQFFVCIFQYQMAERKYSRACITRTDRAVVRQNGIMGYAAMYTLYTNFVGTFPDDITSDHDITSTYDNDGGNYNNGSGHILVPMAACLYSLVYGPLAAEHRPVSSSVREIPSLVLNISSKGQIIDSMTIQSIFNVFACTLGIYRIYCYGKICPTQEVSQACCTVVYMVGQCISHMILLYFTFTMCTHAPVLTNASGDLTLCVNLPWSVGDVTERPAYDTIAAKNGYTLLTIKRAILTVGAYLILCLSMYIEYCCMCGILISPVCSSGHILWYCVCYIDMYVERRKVTYMTKQQSSESSLSGYSHVVTRFESAVYHFYGSPLFSFLCIICGLSLLVICSATWTTAYTWSPVSSLIYPLDMYEDRIIITNYIIGKRYVNYKHIIFKVYYINSAAYTVLSYDNVYDAGRDAISKNPWE